MANVTAVIFDYYETLAELSPTTRETVFDDLARKVGVELPPGEAYRHWRELTTKDVHLRFGGLERPSLDGPAPPFRTFHDVWRHRSRELFQYWRVAAPAELGVEAYAGAHARAPLYPEVRRVLETVRERLRVGVLSDADDSFLHENLRRSALEFDVVVTSEQVRAYKPHVSLFREVCARLDVEPSEAIYVGDSPWADIEGARHAGLRAVWINRHDARWPEDVRPPEDMITSLSELAERLDTAP